ncbi:MAG: enoyl-CoA hydratase/isomerase family protein [Armatimonadetes bacterium]|nr:enoyl-CoA hydratase/isomerase family protein [Armatimonadota bacterium]
MPEYQRLEVELVHSAGWIYLNRPEKRNALDSLMVTELHDAVQMLGGDASVRSIVIAGRGKAFCAGADLAYLQQMARFTAIDNMNDSASLARTLRAIYEAPKPVIARVHGPAIAGGCGLATVCDIVVAVEHASFGYTEVKIGFIPAIVMAFLIRKSQQIQTRELLLSGKIITATEAAQRGLVTTVVPGNGDEAVAALDAHIFNLTAEFAAASGSAIALTKQMLTALDGMPLDSALDYASRMNALARMTPDCQAGIAQFLNR